MTMEYPQPNRATLAVAPKNVRPPPMALTVGSRKPTMQAHHGQFLAELQSACRTLSPAISHA